MRGAVAVVTQRARALRKIDNDAEEKLWQNLRARRLNGFKFVRQLPLGPYFADFACRDVRLVVEVDGSQHAGCDHDRKRDDFIAAEGWSMARFWHVDVLKETEAVLETIVTICEGRLKEDVVSLDFRFVRSRI